MDGGAEAGRSHVVSELAVASDRLLTVLENDAVSAKPVKMLERRDGRAVGRCARVERVQRAEVGSTCRTCRGCDIQFCPFVIRFLPLVLNLHRHVSSASMLHCTMIHTHIIHMLACITHVTW